MKIIHILNHSSIFPAPEISFWKNDWHAQVARRILDRTNNYELECWRPETGAKKIIEGREEGIGYKIFPSLKINSSMEYSRSLVNALEKEARGSDVLIHLHGIHYPLPLSIASRYKKLPIIGQQHGDASFRSHGQISSNPLKFLYPIPYFFEKNALKNIDHFFVLTEYERRELAHVVSADQVEIQTMGVDFDFFKPTDKKISREKLGLCEDNKIILHVGRSTAGKGINQILEAYHSLRNHEDIKLILIGGNKKDILYNTLIESGAQVIERLPPDQLKIYYSAADVFCTFLQINLFGGIGIAPVESLACGTPCVSNTLIHFPTSDREFLGEIPDDELSINKSIQTVFEDGKKYSPCRAIAEKQYSWDKITSHTIEVYEHLFDQYL